MAIPDDRCQVCTGLLGAEAWMIDGRDRACGVCAGRARERGERVEPIVPRDEPASAAP